MFRPVLKRFCTCNRLAAQVLRFQTLEKYPLKISRNPIAICYKRGMATGKKGFSLKQFLAFLGPEILVTVGFIAPGDILFGSVPEILKRKISIPLLLLKPERS